MERLPLSRLRAHLLPTFDRLVATGRTARRHTNAAAVFCLHGLGDLVLAGRALSRLERHVREAGLESVLYVRPDVRAFAERFLAFSKVESIEDFRFASSLAYRRQVVRSLAGRFTMAIQPMPNRRLRIEDCLIRATRAAIRVGTAGHAGFITRDERRCGDRFYTRLVPLGAGQHELEFHAAFMSWLELPVEPQPWTLPSAAPLAALASLERPFLVVCPYASDAIRQWPFDRFLEVALRLAAARSWEVVMVGPDRPDPVPRQVLDLRGRIETVDLPAALGQASLVLCNDSGPLHLANALGRPVVAVGGQGMPLRYYPYPAAAAHRSIVLCEPTPCAGCHWHCQYDRAPHEPARCMSGIACETVLHAAERFLG